MKASRNNNDQIEPSRRVLPLESPRTVNIDGATSTMRNRSAVAAEVIGIRVAIQASKVALRDIGRRWLDRLEDWHEPLPNRFVVTSLRRDVERAMEILRMLEELLRRLDNFDDGARRRANDRIQPVALGRRAA